MLEPRYYQIEAVKATARYFKEHPSSQSGVIVLPTGAGKSIVIFMLIERIVSVNKRVLMLTHRKALVEQNHAEIGKFGSNIDVGVCMGSVKRYEINNKATCASISTYFKYADKTKPYDYLLIDEAHRVGEEKDSRYQTVIKTELEKNPNLRIIGLTATAFNQKGYLTDIGIFDHVIYEKTYIDLVKEGYLSQLITPNFIDFKEDEPVFIGKNENEEDFIVKAPLLVERTIQLGKEHDRKKWLVFAPIIQQAEMVCELFKNQGIITDVIHSKMNSSMMINDFKHNNNLQCLVNVQMFVEGVNVPNIDMIVFMTRINSLNKYRQSLGRGTRVADGKENCLVVDWGGNISKHGQMDDIIIKKGTGNGIEPTEKGDGEKEYGKGLSDTNDIGINDNQEFKVSITGIHFEAITTKKGDPAIIAFFFNKKKTLFNIFYNIGHSNSYVAKMSKDKLGKCFPVDTKDCETLEQYVSLLNRNYAFRLASAVVYRKNKYFNLKEIEYVN